MRTLLAFILSLFLLSCNTESDERIIHRDTMVNILVDMHLNDAIIQIYNLHHEKISVEQSHYDSLFAKHGVTSQNFKWNMAYYQYKQELNLILNETITKLNKKEGELLKDNKIKKKATKVDALPPQKEKSDSISK